MIIDLKSMFAGVTQGSGFGDQEFSPSIGQTLGMIVDDSQNNAAYIDENPFVEAAAFNGSNNSAEGNVTDFYLAAEGQGT